MEIELLLFYIIEWLFIVMLLPFRFPWELEVPHSWGLELLLDLLLEFNQLLFHFLIDVSLLELIFRSDDVISFLGHLIAPSDERHWVLSVHTLLWTDWRLSTCEVALWRQAARRAKGTLEVSLSSTILGWHVQMSGGVPVVAICVTFVRRLKDMFLVISRFEWIRHDVLTTFIWICSFVFAMFRYFLSGVGRSTLWCMVLTKLLECVEKFGLVLWTTFGQAFQRLEYHISFSRILD